MDGYLLGAIQTGVGLVGSRGGYQLAGPGGGGTPPCNARL